MLYRFLLFFACTFFAAKSYSQMSYYLSNKFWRLKHAVINGREYNFNEINSNAPTLQFSGGNIRGNGGCNAYHTKFTINGNSLEINQIMSTRMSCNDMYLSEQEYFAALAATHTLSYEEGSSEFKLVNQNNDELEFFAQFARSGGSYTPPPSRSYNEDNEVSYHRHSRHHKSGKKMSKKELARQRLLEKKLKGKKGKLSKKELRELKNLQSKEKKTEKAEKGSKKKKGKKEAPTSKKSKSAKSKKETAKNTKSKKSTNKKKKK